MQNLEYAKKLLKTYKEVTLEQIEELGLNGYTDGHSVMHELTGFGQVSSCILCQTCVSCKECIYSIDAPYYLYNSGYFCVEDTYHKLRNAKTTHDIYYALQDRIKFLEYIIQKASIA